jgi:hypothetical protein
MRVRSVAIALSAALVAWSGLAVGQTVRWVNRYNGTGDSLDYAADIAVDAEGNVYAAGASVGDTTSLDFAVVSVSAAGSLRWVYRYNQQGMSEDIARSVIVGDDGNIYAAGMSGSSRPTYDVLVVSLTPEGEERWARIHAGPGGGTDSANAITMGPDGNLYVAGFGDEINGNSSEFVVLSLEPDSGAERWAYWYSDSYIDEATSVVCAPDSSIYAAGHFWGSGDAAMAVVKIEPDSGREVWRTTYNRGDGYTAGLAYGNGAVYPAGWTEDNNDDYTVLSLDADSGAVDWSYIKTIGNENPDRALAVTVGADGNVYAAGRIIDTVLPRHRITVTCVDAAGNEQWSYMRGGTSNRQEQARAVLYSTRDRVYACGWTDPSWPYDGDDIVVIQLDSAGNEVWEYVYTGTGDSVDVAEAIAEGPGGEIYVAGTSMGDGSGEDIIVICLEPPPGVIEGQPTPTARPEAWPTVVRGALYLPSAFSNPAADFVLHDASGRRVMDLRAGRNDVRRLAPGVYFVMQRGSRGQGSGGSGKVIVQR